jgi:ribose transport system permease protein
MGYELDAIAAVVLGGTSLSGGVGTMAGTILGALIIGVINNGMNMLSVPYFYQLIVKGAVILIAVWLDVRSKTART